jgi:hypothetical protein
MKLLIPVANKHAPINKLTVETGIEKLYGWEGWMANKSYCSTNWQMYCKLRNHLTKLNKNNKKLDYETKIS